MSVSAVPKLGTSNIRVAVRVRPLLSGEQSQSARSILHVIDKGLLILMDPGTTASDDFLRLKKSREKRYAFDMVFGAGTTQSTVYEQSTEGLIDSVCSGVNACVFTYGATGAGKTFTMLGNSTQPGLMYLTLRDLFKKVQEMKTSSEVKLKCSFLEVYNENIRDLLGDGKDLELRDDPVRGMSAAGLKEVEGLLRVEDVFDLLQRGNRNRTTEPTAANTTSSRSHAVLQVIVEICERGQGAIASIQIGKLSLVDLAGSERASVTNNKGIRLLEGANINRSLLALGNCITALSENARGGKGVFVPYRDSKLTRLLKDSLGGCCRTVMIVNVSPSHLNYEDTRNTLKYGNRAKNIPTTLACNRVSVSQHLSNYNGIINELKSVVYDLKGKLSAVERSTESVREASEQWRQELMDNLDERVRLKKSLIDIKTEIAKLAIERAAMQAKLGSVSTGYTPRAKTPCDQIDDDDFGDDTENENLDSVDTMRVLTDRVNELKSRKFQIEQRIEANDRIMIDLQAELPRRVEDEDVRAFLLLLYRNQVLEIEGMERDDQMEWINRNHEDVLRVKEKEIEFLKDQVRVRDKLIDTWRPHANDEKRSLSLSFEEMSSKLVDVDSFTHVGGIPTSPLAIHSIGNLTNSPRSTIPLSNRLKGIAESILSTSVKTSPRPIRDVHGEIPPRPDRAPSTADSCERIQQAETQPNPGQALETPKKIAVKKPNPTQSTRSVAVAPVVLPPLSVQGVSPSPYQLASTRRSRTENPPTLKQGRRLKQARLVYKSTVRK